MLLTAEQKRDIENIYHKYFNESAIDYWEYADCNYMWLNFYLAKDTSELPHTYWENDCFHIRFDLRKCYEGYCLTADCKDYFIKPIYHDYYAYDRRDLAFRKVVGDWQKVLTALDRFFDRLHKSFISDLDNKIVTDTREENSHYKVGMKRTIR